MGKIPIARLRQAAVTGRRSPLFLYMERHFGDVSEALTAVGKPNWAAIAKEFGDAGVYDLEGKPPTAETARHTWARVRAVMAKQGLAAPKKSRRAASQQPVVTPADDAQEAPAKQPEFRTVKWPTRREPHG